MASLVSTILDMLLSTFSNILTNRVHYAEKCITVSMSVQKTSGVLNIRIFNDGRLTPMFIQEPFWILTRNLPDAYYISVNAEYDFLPEQIEEKGFVILGDIGNVLKDVNTRMKQMQLPE